MRMREDWERLKEHLSVRGYLPPLTVYAAVIALLDGDRIKASWPAYEARNPTKWSVWLVTDKDRLAYAQLQFEANNYNSDEDDVQNLPATVNQAWIRRLSDVVRVSVGRVGRVLQSGWFPVGDIALTFADGERLTLPIDEGGLDNSEHERSEIFLAAVRAGINL